MDISSIMYSIGYVPVDELQQTLPYIIGYIEKALTEAPEYDVDSLLMEIVNGELELFVVENEQEIVAILTTAVEIYPKVKYLSVVHCGGKDMENWIEMVRKDMTSFAKARELDGIVVSGRAGWSKVFGVKPTRTVFIDTFEENE